MFKPDWQSFFAVLPFPFVLEGAKGPLESWVSLVWSVPNGIHLPRNTNRLDSEIDKFGVFVKGKRVSGKEKAGEGYSLDMIEIDRASGKMYSLPNRPCMK